jgi:hypothetical protein
VVCAALALLAPHAHAGALSFTATPNPTTHSAVADLTTFVDYGTNVPKTNATLHLATGALLAHAVDSTSPVSPPPVNGDVVGSVTAHSDPWTDGCGSTGTQNYTLTWVDPVGTGAPTGAVAELQARGSFLGITVTKRVFFVWKSSGDSFNASAHYDVVTPDMPDEITCASSASDQTTTAYGYARSGGVTTTRVVGKNPSATGTAWSYFDYNDTAGVNHSDSDSFSVT